MEWKRNVEGMEIVLSGHSVNEDSISWERSTSGEKSAVVDSSEVMAAYIEGGTCTLLCRAGTCRSLADSVPYIGNEERPR